MRIILQSILIFLLLCLLISCQSVPDVTVTFQDKESLSFTGRGSAAGVMMDSLMPGGIAIGIAIDEGIAKDIARNIQNHYPQFNFLELVKVRVRNKNIETVSIKTWGFKSTADQGLVSAWMILDITTAVQRKQIIYPDDFSDIKTWDFDKVKQDSSVAVELLTGAVDHVFNY